MKHIVKGEVLMKSFIIKFGVAIFYLFISACGSIKVRDKNVAEVSQVKKAAVVAFSLVQPKPVNLSFDSIDSTHVEEIYSDLMKSFEKKLNWSLLSSLELKKQKGYQTAFNKTMKGWQNKMPVPQDQTQFVPEQIMDFDSVRILGVNGRNELCDQLNVDAIIAAKVNIIIEGTTVMGVGKRYPKAQLSFFVYKRGQETPIWFDGRIEGAKSETSIGMTGFMDPKLLNELAVKSAKSAFSKINEKSVD